MQLLPVNNLFEGLSPQLYQQNGNSRYYITEHIASGRIAISRINKEQGWLVGGLLFRNFRMLRNNHHRRENQQDFLCIIAIQAGSLYLRHGSDYYLAEAGDVILTQPGSNTEYRTGPENFAAGLMLLMQGPLLDDILRKSPLGVRAIVTPPALDELDSLTAQLGKHMCDDATPETEAVLCFRILALLSSAATERNAPSSIKKRIEKFITSHLAEELSVEKLAHELQCSKSALNQRFVQLFGMPPHRYITHLRLEQAAKLLNEGMLSIKEIASQLGYNNALNFSTLFRRHFGVAPSYYK